MKLAVIPARGGSKRIPRKNIKEFCGKPIIAWSIEAAKASALFDRIIVSTDDSEIAEISQAWGGEVPFMRPAELAGDSVATLSVIQHAIRAIQEDGWFPRAVCCIYATAPFLRAADIVLAYESLCKSPPCDFCLPITDFDYPIQRALTIQPNGSVTMFDPSKYEVRSQDLEPAWHDAGQFYWGSTTAWISGQEFFSQFVRSIKLPHYRVQDIDSPNDWRRAELLFQALQIMGL